MSNTPSTKKNDGHDIPLWTARKARLWLLSELDEHAIVDMDQLKRYTGFDLIPVRSHNQNEMSYFYAPPIRFSINNVLQLKGSREASVIRRIRAKSKESETSWHQQKKRREKIEC